MAAINLRSADGTELHAQWWPSSSSPPRAVVLVVHGIHQSSSLYRPTGCSTLVSRLNNEAQADVLGLDLRGFGRSSGSYNVACYEATFNADVRAALAEAGSRARAAGVPCVYFGHSLGGLVGAALATSDSPPKEPDAYVLSAPTVKVAASSVEVGLVRLLACCVPFLPVASMQVRGAAGCTNNQEFASEFLAASPSMPFKARYLKASIDAIRGVEKERHRFHRPLLVLSGPPPPAAQPPPPSHARAAASASEMIAHDAHYAGADELVAAVSTAGRVSAALRAIPDAPHDLVFEAAAPGNPAVGAVVEYVRDAKVWK